MANEQQAEIIPFKKREPVKSADEAERETALCHLSAFLNDLSHGRVLFVNLDQEMIADLKRTKLHVVKDEEK